MTKRALEDAIALAATYHRGQKDKAGEPYILHPLRVMMRFTDPIERMVAVLHDLVEDTPVTLDSLRKWGYPETVIDAVNSLTRCKGETYVDFIDRIRPHTLAARVKIADLEDNLLPERSASPPARLEQRYRRALLALSGFGGGSDWPDDTDV